MLTRIALPALAAAAALIATAPLTHDSAQARPVMAPPPSGANPQFERLRAENVRLRAELGQLRSVVDGRFVAEPPLDPGEAGIEPPLHGGCPRGLPGGA
jgi:hypothetical protein